MCRLSVVISFLALLILISCTASDSSTFRNKPGEGNQSLKNAFAIEQQQPPPQEIQSIQLYRKGDVRSAPVIALNNQQKLILKFDYLGEVSKQFKVTVSHRNKDWQESPLAPGFYMDGFNEAYFSGGLKSFSQRPSYYHFTYEFPNPQLSFKVSGNYLLSIYDYETNKLLFSLPFFISENKGDLETRVESLFARRADLRAEDQPFSTYQYPDFVDFPQFDLSFIYAQNQFWGRSKMTDIFDTSSPQEVNFHLSRNQAFLSNYEFNALDLRGLTIDGSRILDVQQATAPPTVVLRRDVQSFGSNSGFAPSTQFGIPADNRSASYANVRFSLETARTLSPGSEIYLLGDFNNWMISDLNRMRYNSVNKLWEGSSFIKEGEYAYKYVLLENGRVNDLALDQNFRLQSQTYFTFVYYKDPARNFDRLLQIDQIRTN